MADVENAAVTTATAEARIQQLKMEYEDKLRWERLMWSLALVVFMILTGIGCNYIAYHFHDIHVEKLGKLVCIEFDKYEKQIETLNTSWTACNASLAQCTTAAEKAARLVCT